MNTSVQQAPSYSVQAANIIRNGIIDGRFQLGQRLNEVELSASIGISRSPIREALRALMGEGLVTVTNGRGAFVATLPISEVRDLLELRPALEVLAVQLAAKRATDEDLDRMRVSIDELAALHREGDDRDQPWSGDFHLDIFAAARNEKLQEQGRAVHRQLRLARIRSGADKDRTDEAREEHLGIFESLCSREAGEAERRMQLHLARGRTHMLELLEHPEPHARSQTTDRRGS